MRIVLLAHALIGQGGWISGTNFIRSLASSAPQHQYLITVPADCGYEKIRLPDGSRLLICPNRAALPVRLKLEAKTIPAAVKDFKADIVLGLGNHGLKHIDCPQAIWIRNGYLVYPSKHFAKAGLATKIHVWLQRIHLRRVLRHTNLVFCQTPVMQKRIAEYYGYDINKIKILPNALSAFLRGPAAQVSKELPKGLAKDRFNCLVLSTYYVHKNPEIIVSECLRSPEKFQGIRFITTIANEGSGKRFLEKVGSNNILSELIYNAGPIAHEKLKSYYDNVEVVIMPTLMESFSITYLEAMYFGVPILTTDLDFAHYLAGNAAVYYDPWKPGSFTEKLLLLKSDQLIYTKLITAGKEQLKKFSQTWEDMAKMAIGELEQLAGGMSKTGSELGKLQIPS